MSVVCQLIKLQESRLLRGGVPGKGGSKVVCRVSCRAKQKLMHSMCKNIYRLAGLFLGSRGFCGNCFRRFVTFGPDRVCQIHLFLGWFGPTIILAGGADLLLGCELKRTSGKDQLGKMHPLGKLFPLGGIGRFTFFPFALQMFCSSMPEHA